MKIIERGRKYLPAGITQAPTTPQEAILAAKALLEEEGRWIQGSWFHNDAYVPGHELHDDYLNDPFCGSWRACMLGALGVVTLGVSLQTFEPANAVTKLWRMQVLGAGAPEAELYRQAEAILSGKAREKGFHDAIHMNDSTGMSRQQVLEFMGEAAV